MSADARDAMIAAASGVCIDVSTDGLAADRGAVAAAADTLEMNPWIWVLAGGEDHALVATFRGPTPQGWRVIGQVLHGPPRVLVDGQAWDGTVGWESF